ncbi:zinc ribbon domain-containing protein [Ktedonospora formicarum]|uniref:Zinc-ribbon domain-containing protein n=1 Tax=Ktedonospora formicarum TaxID=2778364 RepID=A0A8J3HWA0_9CHLR|nr:zinc ribbon domain-containing protein [Ktedonospora formicarum]GHO43186.1 hypothetical protein KSX_13490 [Ktedonospora formicarum]
MRCEYCGAEIAAHARICPACGAIVGSRIQYSQEATIYNDSLEANVDVPPTYEEGPYHGKLMPPTEEFPAQPQKTYFYESSNRRNNAYSEDQASPYQTYSYQAQHIQVMPRPTNNSLLIEVILSLFGIFGIGWLNAGQTTIGLLLLLGSIFIYWPFMILGTIFTLGLGLICLGPLAILAIIINSILLNSFLNRQAIQHIVYNQQSPIQPPPMPMR